MNRSYCGTALYVKVTTSSASGVDTANLVVFAHFEESDANFLSLNDEISASVIGESIQMEQTPKGEWIEGFEQPAAATYGKVSLACASRLLTHTQWTLGL